MSSKTSYNPSSDNYWGRKMMPMELEEGRNEKLTRLYKDVRKHLNSKVFKTARFTSMDLVKWETAEERLNKAYKGPGFWDLPPEYFWVKTYTDKSPIPGHYELPYFIIENEEFKQYTKNYNLLLREKKKVNECGLSIGELKKKIKNLRNEIKNLCYKISPIMKNYAEELQFVISGSSDVEDYQKNILKPYGRNETTSKCEIIYYGAVFGSEYAIYEHIDFWVRDEKVNRHLKLLSEIRALSKKYLLYQITRQNYKRGSKEYELATPIINEFVEKMKGTPLLQRDFLAAFKSMEPELDYSSLSNFVAKSSGRLQKKPIGEALAMILKKRHDHQANYKTLTGPNYLGNDLEKIK